MRAMRRSLVLTTLLLSAVNAAPAVAGAACGPLKIMTSLDVKPDGAGRPMITLLPDMMNGAVVPQAQTGSLIGESRRGLPSLILGMSTMADMHVYIAYKERKLYITAANPQPASAPAAAQ